MKRTSIDVVRVYRSPVDRRRGWLVVGPLVLPCALGRSGTTRAKREGDGATPVGRFRLLQGFYRPDRLYRPRAGLALSRLHPKAGWCDDPVHPDYNRPVRLPHRAGHERMWREDHLYDVVIDIAWNRGPIRKGCGSAIFLHLAEPGFRPTEGCVAVEPLAMRRLLQRLGPETRIEIRG